MQLNTLAQFRIYYNRTIYPELRRLERLRTRLLALLFFSTLILIGILIFEIYLGIWVLTLVLSIPATLFVFYLSYRIRRFTLTFKPQIMQLVLDFIDDQPNIGALTYDPEGGFSKEEFLESGIFVTPGHIYQTEDAIAGKVGEMPFEMCEMNVRENSRVRNRTDYVFKGIFGRATFTEETEGRVLVWPREHRQYLSRAIRQFNRQGGRNVDHEVMNYDFRDAFLTYALEDTHVIGILSEPMQDAIVAYREETGKDIYLSFINEQIYVAITEPKDILEPFIFKSNVSFELVRSFFEDINLLLSIIQDFDQTH